MKNTFRIILFGFLIVASTQRAMAGPIAFDFSFFDSGNGNTVTGVISGLFDNSTGSASSVLVTSTTLGYGEGQWVVDGFTFDNEFIVSGGALVEANFFSKTLDYDIPLIGCCSLFLQGNRGSDLTGEIIGILDNQVIGTPVRAIVTFTRINPVPVPATLALLGVGLLGLCVSRRKRKLQN